MAVLAEINKTTRFLKSEFQRLHRSVFMSKFSMFMLLQKSGNMKLPLQLFIPLSSACCSDLKNHVSSLFFFLLVTSLRFIYINHVRST